MNFARVFFADKYWQNPLAVLDRAGNLLVAHFRFGRIRADQEQKCICLFDTPIDLLLPVFTFGDALPVDPGIHIVGSQDINDFLGKIKVSAGGEMNMWDMTTTSLGLNLFYREPYWDKVNFIPFQIDILNDLGKYYPSNV